MCQSDLDKLGALAMQFRGTKSNTKRTIIATDYADIVKRLIASGSWEELPPPEDELPDDWLCEEYRKYRLE